MDGPNQIITNFSEILPYNFDKFYE